jgi:hypothetical protein
MGSILSSGEFGNIGLNQIKEARKTTIRKWDEAGFLDGLKGHLKENIAQLYENQASYLINEATTTDSSGSFETVVFPIVRRVFSKLLANDIVSVQAMNLPIGKLFYFNPKISVRNETGGSASVGSHTNPYGFPNTAGAPNDGPTYSTKSLYDSFYQTSDYDDSLFDRSKGKSTLVTLTGDTYASYVALDANGVVQSASPSGNQKYVTIALTGFTGTSGFGKVLDGRGNEMDTEEFLASLKIVNGSEIVDFRVVTQKYGSAIVPGSRATGSKFGSSSFLDICSPAGVIYLELDLSKPACFDCDDTTGYTGSTVPDLSALTISYKTYESLEFEAEIAEVTFDIESVTVSVTDRKLRATWSPEMAQDVSAFHNIDAEAELTALLSEQIAAEIDREILRDLRKGAAWTLRWDYNGWKRSNQNGFTPYTQKDWNQTLMTKINQISAQIHKSTLRGGANFIVVSSEVSAILDDLEYFHVSNAAPEEDQYNMGIEKVGSLSGRYTVYRDPYSPANTVLIGHKGKSLLDAGYIYAPYVPLQLTPVMYNPFTFTPVKGISSRYAKKFVNSKFYGKIKVDGVQTFNLNELR